MNYPKTSGPLAQFLEEILPQFAWDLVPIEFIYDLYRAWMKRNCPSDTLLGKNAFAKELEEQVKRFRDWSFERDKISKPDHRMDRPEPLIDEYGLTDSYSTESTGKSGYRGLRRTAIQSTTADDK